MTTKRPSITVLGLGAMGSALARAFLRAGYETYVWNRTRQRAAVRTVIEEGGHFLQDAAAAVASADILIFCLLDYNSIYDQLALVNLGGKIVVNLTNGTPSDARSMSAWAHEHGAAQYFDGGVIGESVGDIRRIEDVLAVFGSVEYMGEDPGAAALYDLAFLAAMYGMFVGAMTAFAMLRDSNPKASQTWTQKIAPGLQALLPSLGAVAAAVEVGDDDPHGHTNLMQQRGLHNIMVACRDQGVDTGALKFLKAAFDAVVAEGGDGGGMAMVAKKFIK
ncbi:hypothetical protein LTR37_016219 [Vermiconidia calcicola]|uniref:Uncharacterized protein n=1 Tax=Vermiconidia calcicola TaxID=1690605 RepID=A0ACC3MNJ2_9PEZI|nr:hypothetical protein LTR37_016219 [Vermiconidia calcicola]